jgi:hypothetical protein
MRALEAFHEAEQIRLALRQTLTVERQVEDADHAAGLVPRRVTPTPPSRNRSAEPEDYDVGAENASEKTSSTAAFQEGQALMLRLPDSIVLDEIIGSYLDFDTIFLVLPQLSKDWQKVIWGAAGGGALLWRKLCERAWTPLSLPMRTVSSKNNDWQTRFMRRPRLRLSGPYITYTVFIQVGSCGV